MGQVHIKVHVVARREAETGRWVAGSPELDVWSSGSTPQEALQRTDEAIILFLDTATEMGTVGEVLRQAGVRLYRTADRVPTDGFFERVKNAVRGDAFPLQLAVPVPMELQAAAL